MRKRLSIRVLLAITLLFLMAFQCGDDCREICYMVHTAVYMQDTADLFVRVENLENEEIIWKRTSLNVEDADTSRIQLWVDPTRSKSTFVFHYRNKDPDIVSLTHQFEEAYSEKCEDYYFDRATSGLEQNSFGEKLIFHNQRECLGLEIFLY